MSKSHGRVQTAGKKLTQVITSPFYFWNMGDEHKYFIVCPRKAVSGQVNLSYTQGLPSGQKLDIIVNYRARCQETQTERFALFVLGAASPGALFDKLITEFVQDAISSKRETFLNDYVNERSHLETALTKEVLRKTGLTLEDVNPTVSGHDNLEVITLGPVVLPIHFLDCDREEDLTVKVELEVDEKQAIKALLNQDKPLTDLIRKATRKYFADNISINTFCAQPDSLLIKQGLTRSLNEALKSVGRRVGHVF